MNMESRIKVVASKMAFRGLKGSTINKEGVWVVDMTSAATNPLLGKQISAGRDLCKKFHVKSGLAYFQMA